MSELILNSVARKGNEHHLWCPKAEDYKKIIIASIVNIVFRGGWLRRGGEPG
jgi:hypothetical protein